MTLFPHMHIRLPLGMLSHSAPRHKPMHALKFFPFTMVSQVSLTHANTLDRSSQFEPGTFLHTV